MLVTVVVCHIGPSCDVVTCRNGGTCTDTNGVGSCTCAPGFSRMSICQTGVMKSLYKAIMVNIYIICIIISIIIITIFPAKSTTNFTCPFLPGPSCVAITCENGGSCMDRNRVGSCHCTVGYSGNRCQTGITVIFHNIFRSICYYCSYYYY